MIFFVNWIDNFKTEVMWKYAQELKIKNKEIVDIYLSTFLRVPFLFVDVGGQRTQRQKWFQVFLYLWKFYIS